MSKAQCESSDNEAQHQMCSRFMGVDDGEQERQRDKDEDGDAYIEKQVQIRGPLGVSWIKIGYVHHDLSVISFFIFLPAPCSIIRSCKVGTKMDENMRDDDKDRKSVCQSLFFCSGFLSPVSFQSFVLISSVISEIPVFLFPVYILNKYTISPSRFLVAVCWSRSLILFTWAKYFVYLPVQVEVSPKQRIVWREKKR